jgi:hypothetical protein
MKLYSLILISISKLPKKLGPFPDALAFWTMVPNRPDAKTGGNLA